MKKDTTKLIKIVQDLKLPYFDASKIEEVRNGKIKITFCLPRNSIYLLVEACKLNNVCISYDNGCVELEFYLVRL